MRSRRVHGYLTKTRYVDGLDCAKWLWLDLNAPERLAKPDATAQFLLEQGRRVGELARLRYPGGISVPSGAPHDNDRCSRGLLHSRLPLFEAGFIHPDGSCYARADVLVPAGKDAWDVVEVKTGGAVKEEFLQDVAFQRYCYTGAGLSIRKCSLLLIDTKYERSGAIDPLRLFREEDITAAIEALESTVRPNIKGLLAVARSKKCPEFGRGEPFHVDGFGVHKDDVVWREHSGSDILDLYRGGRQALELLDSGIYKISDIPRSVVLNRKQAIQRAAHTRGRIQVDRRKISAFLAGLRYPLHFLDFETIGTAVPLFDRVRPYQQIPFQFSVHAVEAAGQVPRHHSFLWLKPADPREQLLESLREALGTDGQVIAYNQTFEKSRLKELAEFRPERKEWVDRTLNRFVDLMAPFQDFAYYNPAQRGSASLKAVLPAITGHGYDGLEIANGTQASLSFLYATFGTGDGKKASPEEVREIRRALERYCSQDTEGLVWIVQSLAELANGSSV